MTTLDEIIEASFEEARSSREQDPATWHQRNIAQKTMKMNCTMARVMGGMDHHDAARVLGKPLPKDCTCRSVGESITAAKCGVTSNCPNPAEYAIDTGANRNLGKTDYVGACASCIKKVVPDAKVRAARKLRGGTMGTF